MTLRYCWLLAAVMMLPGCGREEHAEAVRLCKVLKQKQADFASANTQENDFVAGTRAWTAAITSSGAGRGDDLNRNAQQARDLAQSAGAISTQVGRVRQAIYDQPVTKEYTQEVRSTLIEDLTKRQRALQELRMVLEGSATEFAQLREAKDYKGDTYPGSLGKLDQILATYRGPKNLVADALSNLTAKYGITEEELGK